jgi:transcriptional regulator with XRE-family HTH domain
VDGPELRALRLAAGLSLAQMSARTCYTKAHLGNVENGVRQVTSQIVRAYSRALGIGLNDDGMKRRDFLATATLVASKASLVNDLAASLAGGDPEPLAVVQTSHDVDLAIATVTDAPTVRRLRVWSESETSDVVRVNAAGILAKLPNQALSDHVVSVLEHDHAVAHRYLVAVAARVLGIDRDRAVSVVHAPTTLGSPTLAAQRFAAEALNPSDVGARWCSATLLARLAPALGK